MTPPRADGALLTGACAGLARRLGWNAWALRALLVLFLLIKPLWAIAAYTALTALFWLLDGVGHSAAEEPLESPELNQRSQRIADLERRFRDLERGGRR